MKRILGSLVAALGLSLWFALVLAPAPSYAADDAQVDHSEFTATQLKMLVSVPGDDDIDLGSVQVNIGGKAVSATANLAKDSASVERTTVLAIDTSLSMRTDNRIGEARKAALTFLDTVPDNVKVGIVTFDNDVQVRQAPSLDRDASKTVLDDLDLKLNTALYRGVQEAIKAAGSGSGQHQVLVLSDGEDSTKAPLGPALKAIKDSKTKVDVVSLQSTAAGNGVLEQMATAGGGDVIKADPAELTAAFSSEADSLARQVLVTADLPAGDATSENVSVSLEAGGEAHTANAFLAVRRGAATPEQPTESGPVKVTTGPLAIPEWLMFGAIGAIALGAIGVIFGLVFPGKPSRLTLADQIAAYSATDVGATAAAKKAAATAAAGPDSLGDQARQVAEKALAANAGLEDKIANRLEGAGMALKAPEWVLLHAGIAIVAGILGFLIGGGSIVAGLLFLVFGAIGPWIYLSFKRSQRLKQFNAALADTLQLMSGSLSAGLSLAQSLDTVVSEGSEPMSGEFKRVLAETRLGVEIEDALEGIAERMDSQDFHWVVMAIRIQRQVGGNLAELLLTVAATLREREYLRRHVRALSAEGRLSCWILGGLPPGFLAYLVLTKPDYVKPMFTTPIGWLMIIGMVILLAVGIFWMSKVAKVEV